MKSNMLILHRVPPSGHRYYLAAVGPGPGRGEVPGVWLRVGPGIGPEPGGPVTGPALRTILPAAAGRVAAFDATFAAPKSVSVLHGLASPEVRAQVQAAHDEGVRAGLTFLERHACAVRSAGSVVAAAGLTVAGFRHRTSRALDPHLHTHALVVNRAPAPDDGRPLALHSPLLYGSQRAAGAVYQAVLRQRLTATLGLTWTVPVGGRADAQVVPARVRSGFSGRQRQVLAAGGADLATRGWAARTTRPDREVLIDIEALRQAWRERAAHMGWEVPVLGPGRLPAMAAAEVPAGDRWTRADVMVAVADRCRSGATLAELEAACDRVLADPRVFAVGPPRGWHAAPRYTTVEAAARRARLVVGRRVDGSPEALDHLRRSTPGRVLVVTPDAAAASALSARTGLPAAAVDGAMTATLAAGDTVVLIRPERMASLTLERALRGCRATVVEGVAPSRSDTLSRAALGPAGAGPPDGVGARAAAERAIAAWVDARRHGRSGLLVALPVEVAMMNDRARSALEAAGLRGREVSGWAVGDPVWFVAARPGLGLDRHTLAEITAVGPGQVTLAVAGRALTMEPKRLASARRALVVPPVPSLLSTERDLFVIGGWLPAAVRCRGEIHRFPADPGRGRALDHALDHSFGHSLGRSL